MREIVVHREVYLAHRSPGYNLAMVSDDDLIFGLARMFMAYCEHLPIKITILRTLEAAME